MTSSIIWIGMDVHKDTVMVAVFEGGKGKPEVVQQLANERRKLRRFFERWSKRGTIRSCYEASGAGYVLHRAVTEWGHGCEVIAPSLIPTRPGERRKHDRKDATQLARLYRAGELVAVRVPTAADERVRDLVRCRESFQREILRSRHYVLKFLARRGWVYREGTNWTQGHYGWLRGLLRGDELVGEDRIVLGEYLSLLEYKISRRDELDERITELAFSSTYKSGVDRLRCFRGIDTVAAMTLLTEIGDWRRFERPSQVMAYLGLVPSEHSSGNRQHRGPITKAGNSRCRHVLVQAAWHARHRPGAGRRLLDRQRGQPPEVVAHAWKAQHRLHKVFHRIAAKKSSRIAAVAAARELVGFLWAVMQDFEPGQVASWSEAA